ncbi:MAG: H-type lectin domain-containing protein [Ignavibacteriales bacterium]|nr:H-type lectin domain-containing protein [Ignavibacteriales bacterium]
MKQLTILFAVLFLMAFTTMISAQTQSGQWTSSAGTAGYNLDSNTGERVTTLEVNFPKPYEVKPKVIVSVSQMDSDKGSNTRFNVEVLSISRDGFTIKVKTWADSKLFSIGGYWLAYTE